MSTNEDTVVALTGISISDDDAGTANVTITLQVAHGKLYVNSLLEAGIDSSRISGNGSGTVMITAPQAAINAVLGATDGLFYKPNANFYGQDELSVTTNDRGHQSTSGPLLDSDTVAIAVTAVNDSPMVRSVQTGTGGVGQSKELTINYWATPGDTVKFTWTGSRWYTITHMIILIPLLKR